jgi:hypothetical protein
MSTWLDRIHRAARMLRSRKLREQEMDEELRHHLALEPDGARRRSG